MNNDCNEPMEIAKKIYNVNSIQDLRSYFGLDGSASDTNLLYKKLADDISHKQSLGQIYDIDCKTVQNTIDSFKRSYERLQANY